MCLNLIKNKHTVKVVNDHKDQYGLRFQNKECIKSS